MGRAVFVATELDRVSEAHLEAVLPRLRGVTGWDASAAGQVTIEFDHRVISAETIEEGIAGLGFRVQHVYESPDDGSADPPGYSSDEESI